MSESPSKGPIAAWIVAALGVAVLAAGVGFRVISSWDFWWHLRLGQAALTGDASLTLDAFSHSFTAHPYRHTDVGGDLAFYGAYHLFGFSGIALVRGLVVVLAAFGLFVAMPPKQRSAAVWLGAVAIWVLAVHQRLIPRPLMFSIGMFVVVLGLIERARRRLKDRCFWHSLVPLVAVVWLWINLHRAGLLGLVLMVGWFCASCLAVLLGRYPRLAGIAGPRPTGHQIIQIGIAVVAAVLVGLLNPHGLSLYTSGLGVAHDYIHLNFITEWAPLTWDLALNYRLASVLVLIGGALVTCGALAWSLVRKRGAPLDLWHLGVLVLFGYQSLGSIRWLSYAGGIATVCLALMACAAWRARPRTARLSTLMVVVVGLSGVALYDLDNDHQYGVGPAEGRYPDDSLAFAREEGLPLEVHNTFVYGGYLVWEGFRTLIDGRNDMLYPSPFFLKCVEGQTDPAIFEALHEAHPTTWVLADNTVGRRTFVFLWEDPHWALVHWTEAAVIYVRREAHPDLAERAYRFIHPQWPTESLRSTLEQAAGVPEWLAMIEAELLQMADDSPDGLRSNSLLVLFYHAQGPTHWAARDQYMAHLLDLAPEHPAVVELVRLTAGGL